MPKLNLRSVIDTIALEVAEGDVSDSAELEQSVSERIVAHLSRLVSSGAITKADVDSVSPLIIRGVLRRLLDIAESGGQVGTG